MRFFQDGPNIPDELLWARDEGRVVFLCGAGISMPSGLPSFWELTKYVIDKISPSSDSDIVKAFAPWIDGSYESEITPVAARISFDQIFNLLNDAIGKEAVDFHVSEKLSSVNLAQQSYEHEILARLSSNREGKTQLVTTNFDRLFDSVIDKNKVRNFVPPMFPNLAHTGVDATGITYLHGRLADEKINQSDFILSSSDFGRAYLAEGWATNFIRNLLRRYTVVLVGYSAEDPPVKYLLQGLAASNIDGEENLYAFDKGTEDKVRNKWRDRGVKTISYEGNSHDALWATLGSWALRSDSIVDWRKIIVRLAQSDPKSLLPHERGMVSHMISSAVGAHDFANAIPSPSAEWLCVFDVNCRYAAPYEANKYGFKENNDDTDIDPLALYGLDDDPVRPAKGRDYIGWLIGDGSTDSFQRLAGGISPTFQPISARLKHLSLWVIKQVESPILVWWFAQQSNVHESLKISLFNNINQSTNIPDALRKVWEILFDGLKGFELSHHGAEWYMFMPRFKREGWSQKVIWELEDCIAPKIKVDKLLRKLQCAPLLDISSIQITIKDVAQVVIVYPKMYGKPPVVPSNMLFKVATIVQHSLIRTMDILHWIDQPWRERFTTNKRAKVGEFTGSGDVGDILGWFIRLLDELSDNQPEEARSLIRQWPENDPIIFNRLKLNVLNNLNLYAPNEVANTLLKMGSKQFFDRNHRTELLYLLRDKYNDFDEISKGLVFGKLSMPRERYRAETNKIYNERRFYQPVVVIEWLRQEGVDLDSEMLNKLDKLKQSLHQWDDKYARDAVRSEDLSRARVISSNENSDILEGCLISQVISLAKENSKSDFISSVENAPFTGLVKTNPKRALFALAYAARERNYPSIFWRTLFLEWPNSVDDNGIFLLGYRIIHLPTNLLLENSYCIARWFTKFFKTLYLLDRKIAFRSLDSYLGIVTKELGDASMDSYSHIRESTQGILELYIENELKDKGSPLSDLLLIRLELLVDMPGEGKYQTLNVLANRSKWLFDNNEQWFSRVVFPYFDIDSPAALASWSGLLQEHHWHHVQGFALELKPFLLKLIRNIVNFSDEIESSGVIIFLIESCIFTNDNEVVLKYHEIKDCIRRMDEGMRTRFVEHLRDVGSEYGWKEFVIPFIVNAWPIEQAYLSSNLSGAWVQLLDDTGENFSKVFSVVRDFLLPIDSIDFGLYRFHSNLGYENPAIASKFPEESLDMLLAIISPKSINNSREVEQVLKLVIETKPILENDIRYSRLKKIIAEH